MNKSVKRLILTIVLAALFLGIYAEIMYSIGKRHYEDLIVIHNKRQTQNVVGILDQYQKTEQELREAHSDEPDAEFKAKTAVLADEYYSYVTSKIDIGQYLDKMADEYGGEMFITGTDGVLLYATESVRNATSVSGLGLAAADLEKEYFHLSLGEKDSYICTPVKLQSGQTFVFCYSILDGRNAFRGNIVTQILFAFALLVGLITWCYSVIWMVATKDLTEDQLKRYLPAAVKKRTARLGALSVILVFFVAFISVSMQYMYEEDKTASAALGLLGRQLDEGSLTASGPGKADTAQYEAFGKEISKILAENPEFMDQAHLSKLADMISADYLIVFDKNGNEIACSEDYTGFSLGTEKEEPSTEFRRLLKGIPSIVRETEKDFITGESRSIVGVRYELPEQAAGNSGRYGAILVALPAARAESDADLLADKEEIYRTMVSGGEMIIELDPETMTISSCSREEYTGANASVIGIKKESLADGHMDFFRIDKRWYFSISRMIGGKIFYYLTDNTEVLVIGVAFALLTAVIFLAGYWLLAWFALREYTGEKYEELLQTVRESSRKKQERLQQNDQPMGSFIQKLTELLPEQKYKAVMQIEMGLFMAALLLIAVSHSPMAKYSALNFVIDGNWTKGVNIFGIVAAIMVVSIEYLLFLILKVFFLAFYGTVAARGETVGRLIRSLLNYILVIGAICMALNYLGVDTATLLASLGLFSLAVSLGAKDIVADILSGISIVFEETYSVGDYVEIGGYRGKVLEIGVRSTKLLGGNNDVKTINNHDISNVVNLSKCLSFCSVSFTVRASDPLDEIEAMLARELPALRDKIPGIITGPTYAGVTGFDDGTLTLTVIAGGKEEDMLAMKAGLNRAIQSLYERKLIVPIKKKTNVVLQDEGEK